jgi:hypothetical protein
MHGVFFERVFRGFVGLGLWRLRKMEFREI